MKYLTGEEVKVGDKVRMWQRCLGIVVCSIDTDEYSENYPMGNWSYLQSGILFETDSAGLVHYKEADEDLELIERASIS